MANAEASLERKKAGDPQKSADYGRKAENSFNGIKKMGAELGLTNAQMNYDIEIAQEIEYPKMVLNLQYLRQTAATCKALGLM